MKKILAIILTIVMVLSLGACSNQEENTSDSNFVVSTGGPSADTYLLSSWKEEVDGNREYYLSFYLHSSNYYAILNADSVQFLTDEGEYKALTDAFEASTVEIIDFNEQKQGTSAIALIKTKQMVDNKKIYVLMEGPLQYDEDILTKEDYIAKYNKEPSDEEWIARLCSSSNQTPPMKTIPFSHNDNSGLFGFSNEGKHYFYYSRVGQSTTTDNYVYSQFKINKLTDFSVEQITDTLNSSLYGAKLTDGLFEYVEINEKIQIYCELNDDILTVGYKTIDDSPIKTYVSQLPAYLAYDGILNSSVSLLIVED